MVRYTPLDSDAELHEEAVDKTRNSRITTRLHTELALVWLIFGVHGPFTELKTVTCADPVARVNTRHGLTADVPREPEVQVSSLRPCVKCG